MVIHARARFITSFPVFISIFLKCDSYRDPSLRPRMTVGGGKADTGQQTADSRQRIADSDIRLLVISFICKLAIYAVPAAE